LDFARGVLDRADLPISRGGGPPVVAVTWILGVAGIAATVLLWFEWLFGAYGRSEIGRLERRIVWPMFAGAAMSVGLGLVQAFGVPTFLTRTIFGALGRASGALLDGNAFGMVAALWFPIVLARALEIRGTPLLRLTAGLASAAVLIAVWASGSRTALLVV